MELGIENGTNCLLGDPSLKTNFNISLFVTSKRSWIIKTGRRFLYLSKPQEEMFQHAEDIIDYNTEAIPLTLVLIGLEMVVLYFQKKPFPSLIDNAASASILFFWQCLRLCFKGAEHWMYDYIYQNYRIAELPWDSVHTWYISAILIDLGYYWIHRAGHEINFLWATHQTHHTAEYYSLVTVLRVAVFIELTGGFVYLPLALFVPTSHYLLHLQLNLLFQFWVHTQVIGDLGPLEWIINTPRNHQVHHGSNRVCIDKNYGAVLMIWDHMFGTYQPYPKDVELVYGLVDQPQSLNFLYLTFSGYEKMYSKFKSLDGWKNKLFALIKGPGWMPGTPWTGRVEDIPERISRPIYKATPKRWYLMAYYFLHFFLMIAGYETVSVLHEYIGEAAVSCHLMYILLTLAAIALFIDDNQYLCFLEWFRCSIVVLFTRSGIPSLGLAMSLFGVPDLWARRFIVATQTYFWLSAFIWGLVSVQVIHRLGLLRPPNQKIKTA